MLVQLVAELCCLVAAILLPLRFAASLAIPTPGAYALALLLALLIIVLNGAFGLYQHVESLSRGAYALRFALAPAIGVPLAYLIADALPDGEAFREHIGIVGLCALGGLLLVRHAVVLPLVRRALPHRVLVLGTGPEARLVEASLGTVLSKGIRMVGFYPAGTGKAAVVESNRVAAASQPLEQVVRRLRVDEIIVAVRQQRGGVLPLRELLDCRLNGVQITDLARYFERVHGRVPIHLVKISWLIYGNGYRQSALRVAVKRASDLLFAALLLVVTLPIMAIVALIIVLESGTPFIYRQTRVGRLGKHFVLFKFRSMAPDAENGNGAQWATVNDPRTTRIGRLMRRSRIDELPQLINVIRGEMSFVGPRPERPEFVTALTEQLPFYAVRHSVHPGITGWAQVRYSYGASVEQSMKKLEYDLYYVKNHSLALDLQIVLETVRVVLFGEGAR